MSETQTAMPRVAADGDSLPVYDVIKAQARANGSAIAVIGPSGPGAALSYAELVERTEALAGQLAAHGVRPEQPVAVALDHSADAVVAMLAVLAAGGVYCPVDTADPPARTSASLRRLGVRVAVAQPVHAGGLGDGVLAVPPAGPAAAGSFAPIRHDPDSLAYVLHTSGSTGVPKAVAMTHRGLSRLIAWQVADGVPGLRTLQFTASSFDVTFQEVLSTLATGGCLVVVSDEVRRNPDAMLDVIISQRIQRLFLPYVALQLLAVAAARRSVFPVSLDHVITAGERLIITPAIREFFTAIPHCRLDNHYGPTEAHLVTSLTLLGHAVAWPEVPSIGPAVVGVTCRALDDRMLEVEDGDIGELYVAGTGLARGYLRDARRTAERFVADPFTPGGRLYRTGDLVRAVSGSGFEFVGRADGQLKVRGFRVEPAEVENALLHHSRVDAAAVGLRDVGDGVRALVGYIQADGQVSQRELIEHLRGRLPAYMIPSRFVTATALPRTTSGKVDAQALAALELPAAPGRPAAGAAPEDVITAIWQRVLGHDEFDAEDDFFDVGGDSMLATWVVTELAQELGAAVSLSVFLDYSTVARPRRRSRGGSRIRPAAVPVIAARNAAARAVSAQPVPHPSTGRRAHRLPGTGPRVPRSVPAAWRRLGRPATTVRHQPGGHRADPCRAAAQHPAGRPVPAGGLVVRWRARLRNGAAAARRWRGSRPARPDRCQPAGRPADRPAHGGYPVPVHARRCRGTARRA